VLSISEHSHAKKRGIKKIIFWKLILMP